MYVMRGVYEINSGDKVVFTVVRPAIFLLQ
jgi:hypothetical protein